LAYTGTFAAIGKNGMNANICGSCHSSWSTSKYSSRTRTRTNKIALISRKDRILVKYALSKALKSTFNTFITTTNIQHADTNTLSTSMKGLIATGVSIATAFRLKAKKKIYRKGILSIFPIDWRVEYFDFAT